MSKIDQFESVFNAASKKQYQYQAIEIKTVLVVTDLEQDAAEAFSKKVQNFLSVLKETTTFIPVIGEQCFTLEQLFDLVGKHEPQLICTYRTLHSSDQESWRWPYSLGRHLDVMCQSLPCPVLVVPHPKIPDQPEHTMKNTNVVMALTDHLVGDDNLVNYAVCVTEPKGSLLLAHIENEQIFEYYMEVISKLPSIDTKEAREDIKKRLLKEPHDYITSCKKILLQEGIPLIIEEVIALGQRLSHYKRLIEEHEIDLLVMHTKDDDQLAMHGLAYPLAIELHHVPLFMI